MFEKLSILKGLHPGFFLEHELNLTRRDIAPIVLITQQISPQEMPQLYAVADAYVSPTRGEGWGRTFMEAMSTGLPTIGTRWSGQLDFMNDDNAFLIVIISCKFNTR